MSSQEARDALAENETFEQREQRKREERFRKVLEENPELTPSAIAERFGIDVVKVHRWCDRLGIPRRSEQDGSYVMGRRGQGVVKAAVAAHRGRR